MRGVTKSFGAIRAVDDVSLDIASGEFFAMLGPSGSGKTTMLRMIAGFELPTAGTITLAGVDVTNRAPFDRDVNTVFQDYALFPHMNVVRNVEYGLRVKKVGAAQRRVRVAEALRSVRLVGYESRRPSELSGGQRQRVALARALVNRPKVLLLDEPLGALDLKLREEMQIELKAIQREAGITFIFVTHDQQEALSMSDRVAVFNNGRIEQVGTPVDLYDRPASAFVAGFVGTSNLLHGATAEQLLGRQGTFVIRPEQIRIEPATHSHPSDLVSTSSTVLLQGTVGAVQFLGSEHRVVVSVDDGLTMSATVAHHNVASVPGLGQRVNIRFDRTDGSWLS